MDIIVQFCNTFFYRFNLLFVKKHFFYFNTSFCREKNHFDLFIMFLSANMKVIIQKMSVNNPNVKLIKFPIRKKPTSKLLIARIVRSDPLTLKPLKKFLSLMIDFVRNKTAKRLIRLPKFIAMSISFIIVHLYLF